MWSYALAGFFVARSNRITQDLDICYSRQKLNFQQLKVRRRSAQGPVGLA